VPPCSRRRKEAALARHAPPAAAGHDLLNRRDAKSAEGNSHENFSASIASLWFDASLRFT